MDGRLSNMQNCVAILQSPKNPGGFFWGHTPDWKGREAVAVRQWRRKPEPWKAGDDLA